MIFYKMLNKGTYNVVLFTESQLSNYNESTYKFLYKCNWAGNSI